MKNSSDAGIRAKKIKLIILDVDGVLTDGRITFNSKNEEFKSFDIKDGHGIRIAQKCGIKFAIITGRWSPIVEKRCKELNIEDVHQNVADKAKIFNEILDKYQIRGEEVAYMGDDLTDIPVLKQAGLAATVADTFDYIKNEAHYITKLKGGRGAVRELIDFILQMQNQWNNIIKKELFERTETE